MKGKISKGHAMTFIGFHHLTQCPAPSCSVPATLTCYVFKSPPGS